MPTHSNSIPHPTSSPPPSRRPAWLDPTAGGAGFRCDAGAATAAASEPQAADERWFAGLAVDAAPYSIRVPVPAGETRCSRCRSRFAAAGPTGFVAERPICDLCLLEGSQPLGMLLALAAVVRTFAAVDPGDAEASREASEQLATFARIYERVAARSGPPRAFRFPENLDI